MNFKTLFSGYAAKNAGIKYLLLLNGIVTILLVVLVAYSVLKKPIIVMKIAGMTKESTVGYNSASINYKKGMARFMAHNLGNITPDSARFTKEVVGEFLSPSIYHQAIKMMTDQIEHIKKERLSIEFDMRSVTHEIATDKIFVQGMSVITLPTGERKSKGKTFEFEIQIENYMPTVTYIDAYSGAEKTQIRLKQQKK